MDGWMDRSGSDQVKKVDVIMPSPNLRHTLRRPR